MVSMRRFMSLPVAAMVYVLAMLIVSISCVPGKEDPFALGQRGTPTPTPRPGETPEHVIETRHQTVSAREPVRLADWSDNGINMQNFIVGYLIVYGYDHAVELVVVEPEAVGDALLNGEIDIALETPADWYEANKDSDKIIDAGRLHESDQSTRIVAVSTLQDRAPYLVEYLKKVRPGDEALAALESRITGGRVGITARVAGLIYIRENQETWQQWVGDSETELVATAVADGKTSLVNRLCVPDGGNDNCR